MKRDFESLGMEGRTGLGFMILVIAPHADNGCPQEKEQRGQIKPAYVLIASYATSCLTPFLAKKAGGSLHPLQDQTTRPCSGRLLLLHSRRRRYGDALRLRR